MLLVLIYETLTALALSHSSRFRTFLLGAVGPLTASAYISDLAKAPSCISMVGLQTPPSWTVEFHSNSLYSVLTNTMQGG